MIEDLKGRRPLKEKDPDLTLDRAAASLEAARELLKLKVSIGRSLRAAIRCLLEAQEKLENDGPTASVRLDLLEAIRMVGAAEQEMKGWEVEAPQEEESIDAQNRRAFPRRDLSCAIQLEPELPSAATDITQLPISGMTLNMSRGGMLAKIDQGTLRHGRYLVRFLRAGGNIQPEIMWGAVRRSRARNAGWELGIEFDDPLHILK